MSERRAHSTSGLDLSACDREPIHIPGAIQPHGALVAASFPDLRVLQASENLGAVAGTEATEALGRHLGDVIGSGGCEAALSQVRAESAAARAPVHVEIAGRQVVACAHHWRDALVVELEPADQGTDVRGLDPARLTTLLANIEREREIEAMSQVVVDELRLALGFDRALMYRFDDDGTGEVIAEAKHEAVGSFLGVRFPASDIPRQARELYRANWVRAIPNAVYEPVPLVPERRPDTGEPLDLSFAALRSVSPVHLEYLKNFGARAAASFSVVCRGELWGLITCTHRQPRYLPPQVRADGELVTRLASLQIAALEDRAEREFRESREALLAALEEVMDTGADRDPLVGLRSRPHELLALTLAKSAAICSGGRVYRVGQAPAEDDISALFSRIRAETNGPIFETSSLARGFEAAEAYRDRASGVLAALLPAPLESGVLWFRPEVLETVRWGGDPRKPVEQEAGGKHLHPRTSFREWAEVAKLTAPPWQRGEIEAAEALRRRAVEIDLSRQVVRAEREAKIREELMAIVSHDLRSPLSVIRIAARRLRQAGELSGAPGSQALVERVARASDRMEALIRDLLDMGAVEAGRFSVSPRPEDPRALIDDALATARPLAEERAQSIRAVVQEQRQVLADADRLFQVLSNLLANAIGYSPEGTGIDVVVEPRGAETQFTVADSGPGVPIEHRDKVFDPYWRGPVRRGQGKPLGVGLGLYIARGIVEAHGGRIEVRTSEVGGAALRFWILAEGGDPRVDQ